MMYLEQLNEQISKGILLGDKIFCEIDIDCVLDGRDDDYFDSAWIDAHNSFKEIQFEINERKLIDIIREVSFKATYNHCRDSDLAAYVSDDFELISKALLTNFSNPFINALWECYKNHKIPFGKIKPLAGNITEVL